MSEITFRVTPEEFLREIGLAFKRRHKWLTLRICPFCDGGRLRDAYSCSVHITDGNYFCHRAKCGAGGSFWAFIESQGRNPRDYLGERIKRPSRNKKRFIYGR